MKKYFLLIIVLLNICSAAFSQEVNGVPVEVCFTPGGHCTQDIVHYIDKAQKTILVQAYSFTSTPIAKALVAAKRRGVDVEVILDKSQYKAERYSSSKFLHNAGIPVWIDYRVAIAHNKVMIIDQQIVITGSFNFTKAAQTSNAENLLIINSPNLARIYMQNWKYRLAASASYQDYTNLNEGKQAKKKRKQKIF